MREEDLMRAANRYEVMVKVEQGCFKMEEASGILGLSLRHLRRLRRRYEVGGIKALMFERSHPAWNRVEDLERTRILDLRRSGYRKYNLRHFREVLGQKYGIDRSHEFLRKFLLAEKLVDPQPRRRPLRHRKRFEAPKAGVLIQRDTSIHLWVPSLQRAWRLIVDLDDHSRKITGALFSEHDDVLSNMLVSWETVSTHGLPFAYYTDNNPIYNPLNKKPRPGMYAFHRMRSGEEDETVSQWKRAVRELGIECIHSTPYQPQGKGKIERLFRFLQDRLVREMETAKVTTIHEANRHLKKWVLWYNHCHLHSTTKMIPNERYLKNSIFRPLPGNISLENIFCLRYDRTVKADNTISFEGKTYQIPKNDYRISFAKAKVEARITLSSKLKVFYKKQEIGSFNYKPKEIKRLPTGEDILALTTERTFYR